MPSTSGTYNFQSIEIEILIREAFERIGILGEFTEPQKLQSAKRSIDLLLLEWMNRSINLWTLQSSYLPLITGQRQYTLPNIVSDIIQVNLRTSTRNNTGGTAESITGGDAANAFDGNPTTACTQTAINGNISYEYGEDVTQQINFVGIQSNITRTYSLIIEYDPDGSGIFWEPLFTIPSQTFTIGVNVWFDVPVPINASGYRIRETGGAILDIQEIYFNNNILDYTISDVSRYEYFTYPNKQLQSRPNVYYLDRGFPTPTLNLWPVPSNQYNCLLYTYKQMIQDTGTLYTNTLQIPSRFYPALIAGLTYYVAIKYNPQAAAMFKAEYNEALTLAEIEDSEKIAITISGDYSGSYY